MKYIIFTLLFLVGCEQVVATQQKFEAEEAADNVKTTKSMVQNEITYYKDLRTDLCFAGFREYRGEDLIQIITNVPCTEKVEKILK